MHFVQLPSTSPANASISSALKLARLASGETATSRSSVFISKPTDASKAAVAPIGIIQPYPEQLEALRVAARVVRLPRERRRHRHGLPVHRGRARRAAGFLGPPRAVALAGGGRRRGGGRAAASPCGPCQTRRLRAQAPLRQAGASRQGHRPGPHRAGHRRGPRHGLSPHAPRHRHLPRRLAPRSTLRSASSSEALLRRAADVLWVTVFLELRLRAPRAAKRRPATAQAPVASLCQGRSTSSSPLKARAWISSSRPRMIDSTPMVYRRSS